MGSRIAWASVGRAAYVIAMMAIYAPETYRKYTDRTRRAYLL